MYISVFPFVQDIRPGDESRQTEGLKREGGEPRHIFFGRRRV